MVHRESGDLPKVLLMFAALDAGPKENAMSYGLVLAAMAAGLLPHFPGFSPVFGALLYGGARLRRRDRLWFPLLLFALVYAFQSLAIYRFTLNWGWPATVAAMIPFIAVGPLLRRGRLPFRLAAASGLGATGFFLASNFAIWWMGTWYPHTLAGLGLCYWAGLPFYGNSIVAGALFGGFLFAAEAWLRSRHAVSASLELP